MPVYVRRPPRVPDIVAPSIPTGLAATVIGTDTIFLSWTPSIDNILVSGYIIKRDGVVLTTVGNVTTFVDSGLAEATTYVYAVAAFDRAANVSLYSADLSVTTKDATPPTVPFGLVATAVTATTLTLSWQEPTDNTGVTGYRVKRNGVTIASPTATTFNDNGLNEAGTYTYTVAAHDATPNYSAESQTLTVTTKDVSAPSVPTGLTAVSTSGTLVSLDWNVATDNVGVANYLVRRNFVVIGTPTTNAYDDFNVVDSTTYNYAVAARDASGNTSAFSTIVPVTTADTTAPTVPTGLIASAITSDSLHLAWTASTDVGGVVNYTVYRNGPGGLVAFASLTNSYDDSGLAFDSNYTYAVVAHDTAGNSSPPSANYVVRTATATVITPGTFYSADYSAGYTTGADITPPAPPTGLRITTNTQTAVGVAWNAATDNVAVLGYQIVRNGTQVGTVFAPTLTFTDNTVAAATSYTYQVRAVDTSGNTSALSTAVNVTTPAAIDVTAPSVPTGVALNSATATSVTFHWTASTDNVGVLGYQVFRDNAQISAVFAPTVTYTDTTVTPSTAYSYSVKAVDTSGNISTESTHLAVTTPAASGVATYTPEQLVAAWNTAHNTTFSLVANNTTVDNTNAMNAMMKQAIVASASAAININGGNKLYNCEKSITLKDCRANTVTFIDFGLSARTDDGGFAYPSNASRARFHLMLDHCDKVRLIRFTVDGPNGAGPHIRYNSSTNTFSTSSGNLYDVEREAQHAIWIAGSTNVYIEDYRILNVFGDRLNVAPGDDDANHITGRYKPGNIEILGGYASGIGRIFLTIWACRAPDAILTGPEFAEGKNPGSHTTDDAPSASGLQFGIWDHANAAHPQRWENGHRSEIDIEPYTPYDHVCDIRIGADADPEDFLIVNDTSCVAASNASALLNRFTYHNIHKSGQFQFTLHGTPQTSPASSTIHSSMDGLTLPRSSITMSKLTDFTDSGTCTITLTGGVQTSVSWTGKGPTTGGVGALTGCTGGTGTLHTGNVVDFRKGPSRSAFTWHGFTIDNVHCDGTNPTGNFLQTRNVDQLTVTNCVATYRGEVPFSDFFNTTNFNKGGAGQFGSNTFTKV